MPPSPGRPRRGGIRRDALTIVAVAAVVVTVAMIVLGSTVRVTNSGMGCATWPLCNGHVGPIDRFHALMEQSHRYLATVVSALVIGTAFLAWRQRRHRHGLLGPALAAVAALAVQVGLGALTVLAHNAGWTVGLHLVCAELLLALVAVAAQRAVASARGDAGSLFSLRHRDPWVVAMTGLLLATIVAGTLVVDGGAEAACPSWPLCPSGAPGHLVALQLVHRSLAASAGVAVLVSAWRLRRRTGRAAGALVVVGLLALQGAAGGVTAVLRGPAGAADVHLALATLLWLTAVLLSFGPSGRRPLDTEDLGMRPDHEPAEPLGGKTLEQAEVTVAG